MADELVPPRRHAAAGGRIDDDLLRAFVEATDAMVTITDGAGRILLVNRALEEFCGRTADELHGRCFWDVYVAPEHVVLAQDAVERAIASGTAYPQEGDWITGDGERRRVAMRNTVLADDEGLPYAIACVGMDVTDDRRREQVLHQRAQTDLLTGIANRGALFDALHRRSGGRAGLRAAVLRPRPVQGDQRRTRARRRRPDPGRGRRTPGRADRARGPGRAVRRRRVRHPLPAAGRGCPGRPGRASGHRGGPPVHRTGRAAVAGGERRNRHRPGGGVRRRADRAGRPGDVRGEDPPAASRRALTQKVPVPEL